MNRTVRLVKLGRMGYKQAVDTQMKFAARHADHITQDGHSPSCDTLILVEHNPVYTVGVRSQSYNQEEESRLKSLGAEYHETNRGGLITFHGPGQLVAYPILNLNHYTPSLRWYIGALETTLVGTCGKLGVTAKTTDDVGVWVEDRKIAAIGVHANRYITTHGVSLNCDVDLTWYNHIVACGLVGKTVTSLSKELDRQVTLRDVTEPFIQTFCETFDCEIVDGKDNGDFLLDRNSASDLNR